MYLKKAVRLVGIAGLIVSVVWATEATADVRVRQIFQTDAFEIMGQVMPATLDTNTIWLSDNNARFNTGDTASMILLGDVGRLIQLDHINKQYSEIMLSDTGESVDPEMQQILAMMEIEVEVTPTEEKLKIGDWNCRKYIIEKKIGMMNATTEAWATTDIEINTESVYRILNSLMAYMPDYEKAMKQFSKIEGMIVREMTTAEVMGQMMLSSSELVDIHKEDAPEDAFTIPEGYKKVPMPMPGMQ
jgi:hypothetical protein